MRPAAFIRGAIWKRHLARAGRSAIREAGDIQQGAQSEIAHLCPARAARARR